MTKYEGGDPELNPVLPLTAYETLENELRI